MGTSGSGPPSSAGRSSAFNQSPTSVETDYRHGLGEIITARAADLPGGSATRASPRRSSRSPRRCPTTSGRSPRRSSRPTTASTPASMRNIYSPDVRVASELVVDQLAATMGMDPYQFRRRFLQATSGCSRCSTRSPRSAGGASRCPPGRAQGIAIHKEYKGARACLVEIDCRPRRPGRDDPRGGHRPAGHQGDVIAVDVGLRDQPARPRGADAGRHQRRHRPGADLEPAPARRPLPRGQLGQLLLHAAVEHPARRSRSS